MADSKFKLNMGCHNGGIASRDSSSSDHDTEADARKQYAKNKRFYHSVGYYVWFAKIIDPEGQVVLNDNGVPYRR